MAENQTKAQVILEANTATFMTQIRSVAVQARGIFNRVFSALKLPGLLSIGGLIASSVALPTTGRTIGEAVQMQKLHGQLDRLNATLVAELAPIRMLVMRILIALLAGLNATVRFFSQLLEKFPEIGNFAKGIITIIVFLTIFKYVIERASIAVSKFIFRLLNFKGAVEFLKKHNFRPHEILSVALASLFTSLWQNFKAWTKKLSTFFSGLITLKVFDKALKGLEKAFDKLVSWSNTLETKFISGKIKEFTYFLLDPLLQLSKAIVTGSSLILTVIDFVVSSIVTGIKQIISGEFKTGIINFTAKLAANLSNLINPRVFVGAANSLRNLMSFFLNWPRLIKTDTIKGKLLSALILPLSQLGFLLSSVFLTLLTVLQFLVSAVIAATAAVWTFIGSIIAAVGAFIASLATAIIAAAGLGWFLVIISAIIGSVIVIIVLIVKKFEWIVAALKFIGSLLWSVFSWIIGLFKSIFGFLFNILAFIGKWLWKGIVWVWNNLIVKPIAALGKMTWDLISELFDKMMGWAESLTEAPPFSIQGMSSFGGFSKEELELASPKIPELVTIGTTAINLLDQIKKLIEQQRSAAVKRVSGI